MGYMTAIAVLVATEIGAIMLKITWKEQNYFGREINVCIRQDI